MLMQPPGSASTASPPAARNQSSGASTKPTADTSPTKAWNDALAQAKANSPQQTVTAKPGDSLASIAGSHGDTLSSVETDNPQVYPPDLLHIDQTVRLPKKTPAEVVTGVDNSQIKPIIRAVANANLADQGLHSPVLAHDPGALGEAETESTNSWNTVEQKTINMLMNNNSGAYPEQAASAEVKQLNALEPGNAKFAAANNAALAKATKQWQQMGVTKPQLSPIINAYNNAKQATNPASERQAKNQLNAAIEKSLTEAANQAGSNPQAQAKAMTDRAADIQIAGPQDPAFQTAVDNANYDLQVTKPAQQVAKAYNTALVKARANGALPDDAATAAAAAAANKLKTVTHNAGNSYYADQIIQASQGTIDSITKDMGSIASQPVHSPGTVLEFNQIYGDLSQSVAAANSVALTSHGHASIALSASGKAAADTVAKDIAKNIPQNLTLDQGSIYNEAATSTIGDGVGTALTLATAAALEQQGRSDLAAFLTVGAARGLGRLAAKTKSDITAFATTTGNLNQLRTTWGPFMTKSQLVKATNGYLADHSKDVTQKANAQLGTISQDGDAIVEAESAWKSYGAELTGVEGRGELATATTSLTANNPSTAFAVSQSKTLNEAIAAAIGPPQPSGGGAGSVVQALFASPAWSLPKSTRSFVNALLKTHVAQAKGAGASPLVGQGTFTTLSLVGLGLTAEAAWAKGFSVSSPENLANSAYTALGFGKYTGEVISGFAKTNIVQNFLNNSSAFNVNSGTLFLNLPNGSQFELTNLTNTGWFKAIGSAYYGAGALANVLEASDEFSNGNDVAGGFDIAEGVGNGLNAIKPLIGDAFGDVAGEAVGAIGSGVGVLAVVGQLFYSAISSADEQQAFQQDGIKFLQQGLGLNFDLAQELTWPGGQSTSASNALQAYADRYHIPVKQILLKLNQEPADKATLFVDEAAGVPKQSNGRPVVSQHGDGPGGVGYHEFTASDKGHVYYTAEIPNQADSLVQLHYWANYLFGKNQFG
jgi:hypothetical protein